MAFHHCASSDHSAISNACPRQYDDACTDPHGIADDHGTGRADGVHPVVRVAHRRIVAIAIQDLGVRRDQAIVADPDLGLRVYRCSMDSAVRSDLKHSARPVSHELARRKHVEVVAIVARIDNGASTDRHSSAVAAIDDCQAAKPDARFTSNATVECIAEGHPAVG